MKFVTLTVLLVLVACNGGGSGGSSGNALTSATIRSYWINDDQTSSLPELDFTLIDPGFMQLASDLIECDGAYTGTGSINGVFQDYVATDGNDYSGEIQVGHLAHDGATYSECGIVTAQLYSYLVIGNKLTFCNDTTSVCETYTKQ
jgi:hypothetical protein